MCELCLQDNESTVLLEVRDVRSRSAEKFEAGVNALAKAFGYDLERQQKEISPFRSVRDLEDLSKSHVEKGLFRLWEAIGRQWLVMEKATNLPSNVFVLNDRILINPKTGKPLTKGEWTLIKRDILNAFNFIYAGEEERIVLHALALGKVLKGIPVASAISFGFKKLRPKVYDVMGKLSSPQWRNAVDFASQHAGELIVELKQSQFKKVHDTLQFGIKNRLSTYELQDRLFEQFGEMNRDWRRIAETEIGNAQNNGQLLAEAETRQEGEYIFMRGISSSEACPWCRTKVDGQIVVLLDEAPSSGGDQIVIGDRTYTAVWPGKDNYGRSRRDWWVAAGTQHPFCRCTWVRYTPGFEKWDAMFREAIERAKGRGVRLQKLPEDVESNLKPVPWEQ